MGNSRRNLRQKMTLLCTYRWQQSPSEQELQNENLVRAHCLNFATQRTRAGSVPAAFNIVSFTNG
jgi:hypothetical protein